MAKNSNEQLEQRLQALEKGNRIRSRRSKLRRKIKTGEIELSKVIREVPEALATTPVRDVLMYKNGIKKGYSKKILRKAKVDGDKKLGDLTREARERLAVEVELREERRK